VRFLLPFTPYTGFLPIHVADGLGYYKSEGLDVSMEALDGSSMVVQQVASGNADFGLATPEPIMLGFGASPTYQVVYQLYLRDTFDLLVQESSSIRQLSDLQGKTVGVPDLGGGEALTLRSMLDKAGIAGVQLQPVGHDTAPTVEALRSDKVQALMVAWNTKVSAIEAGLKLRCLSCDAPTTASLSIIASNKVIASNPQAVAGLGRAIAKASVFSQTNPDGALAAMKQFNPSEQADMVYARGMAAEAIPATTPADGKYGFASPAAWTTRMQDLIKPGAPSSLDKPVDIEKLLNNSQADEYVKFDRDAVVKQAKEYKPQ
jgi:NitT/TauT family transport system substrate-binding protein